MRSRVLALLLVLAMLPSVTELVEALVHVIEHGDLAHGPDDHHGAPEGDEHGCSGLFHMCSCHTGASLAQPSIVAFVARVAASDAPISAPRDHHGRGNPQPPHRPPIG